MFQVIGQTVVELRDDRLHITQQARARQRWRERDRVPQGRSGGAAARGLHGLSVARRR